MLSNDKETLAALRDKTRCVYDEGVHAVAELVDCNESFVKVRTIA